MVYQSELGDTVAAQSPYINQLTNVWFFIPGCTSFTTFYSQVWLFSANITELTRDVYL